MTASQLELDSGRNEVLLPAHLLLSRSSAIAIRSWPSTSTTVTATANLGRKRGGRIRRIRDTIATRPLVGLGYRLVCCRRLNCQVFAGYSWSWRSRDQPPRVFCVFWSDRQRRVCVILPRRITESAFSVCPSLFPFVCVLVCAVFCVVPQINHRHPFNICWLPPQIYSTERQVFKNYRRNTMENCVFRFYAKLCAHDGNLLKIWDIFFFWGHCETTPKPKDPGMDEFERKIQTKYCINK